MSAGLGVRLLFFLVVLCGQIKPRAVKELFERERGSERPCVKGISFYLIPPEGDLLDLDSWKERADPHGESSLFRPEYAASRWVVGTVLLAVCQWVVCFFFLSILASCLGTSVILWPPPTPPFSFFIPRLSG